MALGVEYPFDPLMERNLLVGVPASDNTYIPAAHSPEPEPPESFLYHLLQQLRHFGSAQTRL